MDPASYRNWELIAPPGTVNATVRATKAVMVIGAVAGVVAVGGKNTGSGHDGSVVNFGTVALGTVLPLEVTTVGSATTATLIAMR